MGETETVRETVWMRLRAWAWNLLRTRERPLTSHEIDLRAEKERLRQQVKDLEQLNLNLRVEIEALKGEQQIHNRHLDSAAQVIDWQQTVIQAGIANQAQLIAIRQATANGFGG